MPWHTIACMYYNFGRDQGDARRMVWCVRACLACLLQLRGGVILRG